MNPITVIWTVVAALGVVFCVWALRDSLADWRYLRRTRFNGSLALVARMGLRSAGAGVLMHVFFLGLGVLALLTPNPRQPTVQGTLLGIGFVTVAAANVLSIGFNLRDRQRLGARVP